MTNPNNSHKITNAKQLAEKMERDPDCKFKLEMTIILELINDPEKLQDRFKRVQLRIQKEHDRDMWWAKRVFFGALVGGFAVLAQYWLTKEGYI